MKTVCALIIVAAVGAAAPPRIELDLSTITSLVGNQLTAHTSVGGTGTWDRHHDIAGSNRRGVQDYTERCPAGSATDSVSCPLPIAHAWDAHGEQEIPVTRSIYLVDDDGDDTGLPRLETSVTYNKRRTYLVKYDAEDTSGNKAEQLVFALILDDVTPPTISCDTWSTNGVTCDCQANSAGACQDKCAQGEDYVIEAAAGFVAQTTTARPDWALCSNWHAFDTVQGYVDSSLNFKVTSDLSDTPLYDGASSAEASAALTQNSAGLKTLGRFELEVTATDSAGGYGHGGSSNKATKTYVFNFEDTQAPTIVITGTAPNYDQECGQPYSDQGAEAFDARGGTMEIGTTYGVDQYTNERPTFTRSSNVDTTQEGAYNVTYTAVDAANNQASAQRFVLVVDTTAPAIELVGDASVTRYVQAESDDLIQEPGVAVHDLCDPALNNQVFTGAQAGGPTSPKVTMTWAANADGETPDTNNKVTGTFVRSYKVWDTTSDNLYSEITRTFVFVDDEEPWVELNGNHSTVTIDACNAAYGTCTPYVDGGARCFDYVGGEMSQSLITVVTNDVDESQPGNYSVTYQCRDLADPPNLSQEVTRTVIVSDATGCPEIEILGDNPMTVEANFPFADPGATATDNLEGTIAWNTGRITTIGNTVDTAGLYPEARSCQDIADRLQGSATSGRYRITGYTVSKGFFRMNVFCDMSTLSAAKTYKANVANGSPVVPYGTDNGACTENGLVMATLPLSAAAATHWDQLIALYNTNTNNPTNVYICEADATDATPVGASEGAKLAVQGAEPGTYHISYHVTDSSGNTESSCGGSAPVRTVNVVDRLAPVISLHVNGNLLVSSNAQANADSPANPAWDTDKNPFLQDGYFDAHTLTKSLMAQESAPVSGWMLAAAASAVAGVALLAATRRPAAIVTSVPV